MTDVSQATASTKPPTSTPTTPAKTEGSEPSLLNQGEGKTEAGKTEPSVLNEKDAPAGAPEKYDLKLPDGYKPDEAVMTEATTLFKDLNLPQDAAQKLVEFYANQTKTAADAVYKVWEDTNKQWADQVKADPEIGNKLPEVRATIAKLANSLGDPKLTAGFREALDLTGAGNHPAFIKAFYKIAQRLTEGRHVSGGGPSEQGQRADGKPATPAKAMYPNLA